MAYTNTRPLPKGVFRGDYIGNGDWLPGMCGRPEIGIGSFLTDAAAKLQATLANAAPVKVEDYRGYGIYKTQPTDRSMPVYQAYDAGGRIVAIGTPLSVADARLKVDAVVAAATTPKTTVMTTEAAKTLKVAPVAPSIPGEIVPTTTAPAVVEAPKKSMALPVLIGAGVLAAIVALK